VSDKLLTPTPGRVVIELDEREEQMTASGRLYIPATARSEKPIVGKVYAIPDAEMEAYSQEDDCKLTIGQMVIFGQYTGSQITIGRPPSERKFLLVRHKDVMAVIHQVEPESVKPVHDI
jgi:chaperonin GroES